VAQTARHPLYELYGFAVLVGALEAHILTRPYFTADDKTPFLSVQRLYDESEDKVKPTSTSRTAPGPTAIFPPCRRRHNQVRLTGRSKSS
jgi:hypothetical protein